MELLKLIPPLCNPYKKNPVPMSEDAATVDNNSV
jgi:hypothetical protein